MAVSFQERGPSFRGAPEGPKSTKVYTSQDIPLDTIQIPRLPRKMKRAVASQNLLHGFLDGRSGVNGIDIVEDKFAPGGYQIQVFIEPQAQDAVEKQIVQARRHTEHSLLDKLVDWTGSKRLYRQLLVRNRNMRADQFHGCPVKIVLGKPTH